MCVMYYRLTKRLEENITKDRSGTNLFVGDRRAKNTKLQPQKPVTTSVRDEATALALCVTPHHPEVLLQAFRARLTPHSSRGGSAVSESSKRPNLAEIEADFGTERVTDGLKLFANSSSKLRATKHKTMSTQTSKKATEQLISSTQVELRTYKQQKLEPNASVHQRVAESRSFAATSNEYQSMSDESGSSFFFDDDDEATRTPTDILFTDPLRNPPYFVRVKMAHLADLVLVTARTELLAAERRAIRKRALQHNE